MPDPGEPNAPCQPPARPIITIDPGVAHGRPAVGGVGTVHVAGMVYAGEDFATTAEEYGLTVHQVILACWWEGTEGRYRQVWRSWAEAVEMALGGREPLDVDRVHLPPRRGGVDE